jgi:Zn-dependent alcohol dehydrogenase
VTTTKAYVVDGADAPFRLDEIRIDPLRQDEVLVRVVATGVCHTDLSWRSGAIGGDFPVVLGHETSGIVEGVGRDDSPFAIGDRVVVAITHHCGMCRYCESGVPVLCADRDNPPPRFSRPDGSGVVQVYGVGGFAERIVLRQSSLVKVPDDIPLEFAAVLGCAVACGTGAVWNVAELTPGSTAVVFGAGAIGSAVIVGCRIAGAGRIVVVDPNPARRASALDFGATEAVEPDDPQLAALGGADGFDYAFESAGRIDTIAAAVDSVRRGGTVTLIGAPPADAEFSLNALDFVASQKRILGCLGGNPRPHDDFPRLFELYRRGVWDVGSFVSRTLPFDRIEEAFAFTAAGDGIRTVLVNAD